LIREGDRLLRLCNACRYCEGFCAVFPAMERRSVFSAGDVDYLANFCHNCGECYYACPYTPPHEYGVNLPKVLTENRVESYARYGTAPLRSRLANAVAVAVGVGVMAALAAPPAVGFYSVISHRGMVGTFGSVFVLAAVWL